MAGVFSIPNPKLVLLLLAIALTAGAVESFTLREIELLTGETLPQVTNLSLSEFALSGGIPEELGRFTNLTHLDLSSNGLTDPIPEALGHLENLVFLSLFNNSLTGSIPPGLGNLTRLVNLNLAYNQLSGAIPPALGNLSRLEELRLSDNEFLGPIPSELGRLTSLRILDLGFNDLSGSLPTEFANLVSITSLVVSSNDVSGSIPPGIGTLVSLVNLDLRSNDLSGPIPSTLGNLPRLANLDLRNNELTGAIPSELGKLSNLTRLQLSSNKLSGPLPLNLTNLVQLTQLLLASNNLSGSIPRQLGALTSLTTLDLSGNELSGSLLQELGKLTHLVNLDLHSNDLVGSISGKLLSLFNLSTLDLSSNLFSGAIPPELGTLPELTSIDLSYNELSGPIPPSLSNLTNLEFLDLSSNPLSGSIPVELANLVKLTDLILFQAALSGPIPKQLGNLVSLTNLDLSDNNLTGPIPELRGLALLKELDLSSNGLSGPFPSWLDNLPRLTSLNLYNNTLSGPISEQLRKLVRLTNLDLSSNNLTGSIPAWIGNLTKLTELRLSSAGLTDAIPQALGSLPELSELDLSSNNLVGPIPSSFAALSLSTLNLSRNGLTGVIPFRLDVSDSLDLSFNSLRGSCPPIAQDVNDFNVAENNLSGTLVIRGSVSARLNVSYNQLSGALPAAALKAKVVDVSHNNFTGRIPDAPSAGGCTIQTLYLDNNAFSSPLPESISNCKDTLVSLGFSGFPPSSVGNLSRLRSARVGPSSAEPQTTPSLDLSGLPKSCQYVRWTGGPVNEARFWPVCSEGSGCVLDLIASKSKLSQQARRRVCLGKVSVLLEGDAPYIVTELYRDGSGALVSSTYLANAHGNYFLNSTSFLDDLDLGPGGLAYTGVGYTRVQAGNLCSNPEAERTVVIVYSIFGGCVLVVSIAFAIASKGCKPGNAAPSGTPPRGLTPARAKYCWAVGSLFMSIADLVTDILVLESVWGAWPAPVVLVSIAAPLVLSAFLLASHWVASGRPRFALREVRARWVWPPPESRRASGPSGLVRDARPSWRDRVVTVCLLPVSLPGGLLLDGLAALSTMGLHLTVGGRLLFTTDYHKARVLGEALLESVPQAAFQSALYVLGSSRATRIYIDERIFVQSIGIALASVYVQYCDLLWEALRAGEPLWRVIAARLEWGICPRLVKSDSDTNSAAEERIMDGNQEL